VKLQRLFTENRFNITPTTTTDLIKNTHVPVTNTGAEFNVNYLSDTGYTSACHLTFKCDLILKAAQWWQHIVYIKGT
jgi:hypothetical protein